jgi:TetR/AcrR family transcriptional repressor of mexJK operon
MPVEFSDDLAYDTTSSIKYGARATQVTQNTDIKVKRHTGGRPSQQEALKRDERLVEIAARMFMERGFEATTIDAVAEEASIGKATLYARYRDKGALFAAVLRRKIDRWLVPLSDTSGLVASSRVEEVLLTVSRNMMALALAPEAVMLHRVLVAEASRFPELIRVAHEEGWQRSNAAIAVLLEHFTRNGQIAVEDPELAAELFLSLVVGRQTRLAALGIHMDPAQVDHRIQAAVHLFLDGVRRPPWAEQGPLT